MAVAPRTTGGRCSIRWRCNVATIRPLASSPFRQDLTATFDSKRAVFEECIRNFSARFSAAGVIPDEPNGICPRLSYTRTVAGWKGLLNVSALMTISLLPRGYTYEKPTVALCFRGTFLQISILR